MSTPPRVDNEIMAAVATADYLHDQFSLVAKGATTDEERRIMEGVLKIIDGVRANPKIALPESHAASDLFDRALREAAASSLVHLAVDCASRIKSLQEAEAISAELGWDMLSQKGMMSAFTWVYKMCVSTADSLAPGYVPDSVVEKVKSTETGTETPEAEETPE